MWSTVSQKPFLYIQVILKWRKLQYILNFFLGYLLIEGFENNLDREVIMANATESFKKQWGDDKVITS